MSSFSGLCIDNKTNQMKDSIRYAVIVLTGMLLGIFVFLPINELTSYYEYHHTFSSDITIWQFIYSQFIKAVTLETPLKFFIYLIFGGLMGAVSLISLIAFKNRNSIIFQLRDELGKSLPALIKNKEDDTHEFKSSFRYDYKQQKPNKALESVITKTLAGFMNTRGGSLLIGVADDGTVLGLENDYNTLNRKDSDGYTQLITSVISEKMGAPACRLVRILFHEHEGKEVCRIIVLPSPVPIYVTEDKMARFFIRTASGTREMDVQEALTFIKERWK
jgi:hypothetical protein